MGGALLLGATSEGVARGPGIAVPVRGAFVAAHPHVAVSATRAILVQEALLGQVEQVVIDLAGVRAVAATRGKGECEQGKEGRLEGHGQAVRSGVHLFWQELRSGAEPSGQKSIAKAEVHYLTGITLKYVRSPTKGTNVQKITEVPNHVRSPTKGTNVPKKKKSEVS